MSTIYIDEVFIINLVMNLLILQVSKRLLRASIGKIRLSAAGALGAVYSVIAVIYPLWLLDSLPCKLIFSGLLVWLAFGYHSPRTYLKALSAFYIVSFGFGGAVYGVISLVQYNGQGLPIIILITASALAYGLIALVSSYHRLKLIKEAQVVSISVTLQGKTAELSGFVDTGNTLYEPFSMLPVIIAEHKKIKGILPADAKISYIPFRSVGSNKSVLQGVQPEQIVVTLPDRQIFTKDVIIAVYEGALSTDNSYDALINPSIFKEEHQ